MAKSKAGDQATAVVPTKQLTVSTFRKEGGAPSVLSVEIGDHVALFSGGAGHSGLYATSNGKTLHRRQAPGRGLRGIKFIGDELWIMGEYGTLAVSTDLAASWTEIETPTRDCLSDIQRDSKGGYWVAGYNQKMLRSTKRGAAFTEYVTKLPGKEDRADPRVESVPVGVMFLLLNAYWDGSKLQKAKGLSGAMTALAVAPHGTIVIVGSDGAAFRSVDGGKSYAKVNVGVKVHLEDVAVVAGGFLAVGDKGTLRRSEDDGATWKPLASNTKTQLWSIGSWGGGAFVGGADGLILRIDSPGDTYWKAAVDQFAPRPIVPANITPLRAAVAAELDARFALLFAEAKAAHLAHAAKVAQPKFKADVHSEAILKNLDDVDEYKVYGDALQAAGDPRGELIALQTAGQAKAATKYLKQHRASLLGGLAEVDASKVKLEWKNGFIHTARVAYDTNDDDDDPYDEETEAELVSWLSILLEEPSARFLQDLTVGIVQYVDNSYDAVMREIGRRPRSALRSLFLGDFDGEQTELSWSSLGDVSKLCGACERLRRLTVRSGSMNFGKPGQLVFPHLRELVVVTGGLTRESLKSIAAAHLPWLERLELYLGTERYGCNIKRKDVDALLASARFPRLTHLGLVNSEIADELCQVLHLSPLVAQVKELDLSRGTLSDVGANALATYAKAFQHLEKLDIRESYVSPAAAKVLQKALPRTEVDTSAPRGDAFERRYVSISE